MSEVTTQLKQSLAIVPPAVTEDQLDLIKRTVAKDATNDELKLFFYDCQRRGVHPLDKLLHFTKRDGKYTPVTSIDFMRSQASDSGEYAGNDDAQFLLSEETQRPIEAHITVYRMVQGQRCPFTATARWSEYFPGDKQGFMWRKMPHTMLGKCAEALALRKAFPRQLAGLYERSEMDQAGKLEREEYVETKIDSLRSEVAAIQSGDKTGYHETVGATQPIVFESHIHDGGKTGEATFLVLNVTDAFTQSPIPSKNGKPYVWVGYGPNKGESMSCFDTALFEELKASVGSTIDVFFKVGAKGDSITGIVPPQKAEDELPITEADGELWAEGRE